MKKTNLLITLVSMLCLCACGGQGKQNAQEMSADSIEQPLVGGSRDAHGCLISAGYTWSEVRKDCIRLFEEGICLEDVEGNSCIVVFSSDSARVELFFSNGAANEILDRRSLPKGGFVWNVEDDDTKNLRLENGEWVIRQRNKVVYTEAEDTSDATLGKRQHFVYSGVSSGPEESAYTLQIISREHSGDGRFVITHVCTDAKTGSKNQKLYKGKRFTLRGMAGDNDATVWQLISDDEAITFNFLRKDDHTLILLDKDLKENESVDKVVLKRVD